MDELASSRPFQNSASTEVVKEVYERKCTSTLQTARGCAASTDLVAHDELCISAQCRPCPNVAIAELPLFIEGDVLLLRVAKRPDFFALDALARKVVERLVLIFFASSLLAVSALCFSLRQSSGRLRE